MKNSKAIQKAKEDFDGLYQYWSQISDPEEYYFVINDKYKGSYPEVEKTFVAAEAADKEWKEKNKKSNGVTDIDPKEMIDIIEQP